MFDRSFLTDIKEYYGSLDLLLNPYSSSVGTAITYGLTTSDMTSVMTHPWLMYVQRFLLNMATINLSLAVFNLLPIPPLDGYHLFNDLLLQGQDFSCHSEAFHDCAGSAAGGMFQDGILNTLL